MTRESKREIEQALEELEQSGDSAVFAELWMRSAADEDWREDEKFMARLQATVEKDGWPANPWDT